MTTSDDLHTNVVVIGSGVAGAFTAWSLARRGIDVIVLEAGPRLTRAELFDSFTRSPHLDAMAPYPNPDWAPMPSLQRPDDYLIRDCSFDYRPQYIRIAGGTTWHWSAGCDRLGRKDVALNSTYGVGVDWPIGRADLDGYYDIAEHEMGITGPGNKDPRLEVIPIPYVQRVVKEKLARHGIEFREAHHARLSHDFDGRPRCQGNNNCIPLCPIGAQYSADLHVTKAEREGARIVENALVTGLEVTGENQISAATARRPDGSRLTVRGDIFVVAANGIETPRLALLSASEKNPNGLCNSIGEVGRNFMDHPGSSVRMLTPEPLFSGRGPVNGTVCDQFEDGPFRKTRGGFRIGLDNKLQPEVLTTRLVQDGTAPEEIDRSLRHQASHQIAIGGFTEVLPNRENRVSIDRDRLDSTGLPRIRLRFHLGEYERAALRAMRLTFDDMAKHLGTTASEHAGLYTANHLMGTMRMGDSPTRSVVDRDCRAHDHPNLFVAGSSVFPNAGGAKGPTLTIAALALRTADAIALQLAPRQVPQ